MMKDLLIFQNFGLYQGYGGPNTSYLHGGLDVMLPNGTDVFAVASGTVRHVNEGTPLYRGIIIEDEHRPGYAWSYTHVDSFRVKVGDYVPQGTLVAEVRFRDADAHVHLDYLRMSAGGAWEDWYSLYHLNPISHFALPDAEPPVVDSVFHYFRNGTDTLFPRMDGVAVVSGDVDIAVGMRDPAPFARGSDSTSELYALGDRTGVTRIEFEIAPVDGGVTTRFASHDFRNLELPGLEGMGEHSARRAYVIYKYHGLLNPPGKSWPEVKLSYYVLTNVPPGGRQGLLDLADAEHAWHTAELDADGNALFPNGLYTVIVRAWDAAGNTTEQEGRVRIHN